jgi:hypothetical protein
MIEPKGVDITAVIIILIMFAALLTLLNLIAWGNLKETQSNFCDYINATHNGKVTSCVFKNGVPIFAYKIEPTPNGTTVGSSSTPPNTV